MIESKLRHRGSRFGGVALTPTIGVQLVADLCLVVIIGVAPDAAVADEPPVASPFDCQLEPATRPLGLPVDEHRHEGASVIVRALIPRVIAQITRVALVIQHGPPIFRSELAQAESLGDYLHRLPGQAMAEEPSPFR